jgi:alkanesulfonate monooxygenase SsuD/methylene tetrahydromethanopterin reductase-like flavin-dependent oxidoreductase (luciferase family)
MAPVKLGTSLRFLFPTSPETHEAFRRALAAAPAGSFIERPMGAYDTAEQARNWLEVATAARAARLDGLLVGDNHAVPASYADCFAPIPSLARLMAVTGDMPVGMVLVGGPATVVQQLREYAAMGFGHVMVRHIAGDHARMLESFDRIGRHVMPAIRDL